VHGQCDVLIFHPRHDLTLARLSIPEIIDVISEWVNIYKLRSDSGGVKYIQIFEVIRALMCCTMLNLQLASEQGRHDGLL
jgi:UDPglucose--hexose-1-phosphate uridylyltransferase